MRNYIQIIIRSFFTRMAFATMASAACYQNTKECLVGVTLRSIPIERFPSTGGCFFEFFDEICNGGPNSAIDDSTKATGFAQLGDECGIGDLVLWERAGIKLNLALGVSICIPTSGLVNTGILPGVSPCGGKVGINSQPCQPAL